MKRFLLAIGALSALLIGCKPSFEREMFKQMESTNWTREQKEAALAYGYRLIALKENSENPDRLDLNFRRLSKKKALERSEQFIRDIDDLLSYESMPDNARYVDHYELRSAFEAMEQEWLVRASRMRTAYLHQEFLKLTGEHSSVDVCCVHGDGGSFNPEGQGYSNSGYGATYGDYQNPVQTVTNIRDGFTWEPFHPKPIQDLYKFSVARLEDFKMRGLLRPIETSRMTINRELHLKIPDPADRDDPKKFKWEPLHLGLEIVFFKTAALKLDGEPIKPNDNVPDYAEAFRLVAAPQEPANQDKPGITVESQPCLKVFKVTDGVVLVIDKDRQNEPGYGVPDSVEKVGSLRLASEVFQNHQLMGLLFGDKKQKQRAREKPKDKVLDVRIAEVGPIDEWEVAVDKAKGWPLPVGYKNEQESNFNVKLKWQKRKPDDIRPVSVRRLERVEKEWYLGDNRYDGGAQAVVECFNPKDRYAGNLIRAEVQHFQPVQGTKTLLFVFEDGGSETGLLLSGESKYIETPAILIQYSEAGERYELKYDAETKVYLWRRSISNSNLQTGVYGLSN